MLPLHSYLVLVAFSFMGLALLVQVLQLHSAGQQFLGSPTIERLYFYTGKVALFVPWVLFMLKAINPELGYLDNYEIFYWTGIVCLYTGTIILVLAFFTLGRSLKVGLTEQPTTLQTRGIYHFSRNPIYIGAYLVSIGSCFYFPDLISATFTVYTVIIHHQVILREEQFLAERFGTQWEVYRARVSRYI